MKVPCPICGREVVITITHNVFAKDTNGNLVVIFRAASTIHHCIVAIP